MERVPDEARRLFQRAPLAGRGDTDAKLVRVAAAVEVDCEASTRSLGDRLKQSGQRFGFGTDELPQNFCGHRAVRSGIIDADRIRSVHDGTCWLDASTVVVGG